MRIPWPDRRARSGATGAAAPRPRAPRAGAAIAPVLALGVLSGCVYYNTFYNAKRYYARGEKLVAAEPQETLPAPARTAFEKSIEKSSSVLAAHPDSKYADDALLLLGKAHFRLGNHAEAATALRTLVEGHPRSGLRREAMVWLVRAARESGDSGTALRLADELIAAGDLSAAEGFALDLERAQLAADAGEPAKAVEIYEELGRTHPAETRREDVPLLLTRARLDGGDREGALRELRALVQDDRDPALQRKASVALAEVLSETGLGEEARATYLALLEGNVADSLAAEIHIALAEGYGASGDFGAAVEQLSAAAGRVPASALAASALYHEGLLQWHRLRERDAARETFLEAYLEAPEAAAADSATAAARTLGEIRHYESILDGSERVLSPLPAEEVRATVTYLLAELVYTAEDDRDRARELFGELLQRYPASAWVPKVLYTLAWLAEERAHEAGPVGGGTLTPDAVSYYRRLVAEFGGTEYGVYAAQRLADAAASVPGSNAGGGREPVAAPPAPGPGLAAVPAPGTAPGSPSTPPAGGPLPEGLDFSPGTAGGALLPLPADSSLVQTLEEPVVANSPEAAIAGAGAGAPAPAQAAGAFLPQTPAESVDEKLLAFTRAIPRAPDPLIGIQDRLLARRRELEPERGGAGGRQPGPSVARSGAGADSLQPAAGAGPGDAAPGGDEAPGGQAPGTGEQAPQRPGATPGPQGSQGRDDLR